jgi:hypothetical protein
MQPHLFLPLVDSRLSRYCDGTRGLTNPIEWYHFELDNLLGVSQNLPCKFALQKSGTWDTCQAFLGCFDLIRFIAVLTQACMRSGVFAADTAISKNKKQNC